MHLFEALLFSVISTGAAIVTGVSFVLFFFGD